MGVCLFSVDWVLARRASDKGRVLAVRGASASGLFFRGVTTRDLQTGPSGCGADGHIPAFMSLSPS